MKAIFTGILSLLLCANLAHAQDLSRQFKRANPAVVVIKVKEQQQRGWRA